MLGVGYCAFNWNHLYSFKDWATRDGPNPFKPTIEFRIHEGTLDSAAVLNWIELLAGFTQWCIDASYDEYASLLCKTTHETWEKFGDGKDEERERLHGPIAAEGAFTIIDLLREIGLAKVADYYEKRGFYKVEKLENHRHTLLRGGYNSSLPESSRRDAS
ncbi:hypothetical protein B0O99DRAFT_544869 [Bisporella sp. PMI_857]|nr:hypothetical protein B0O99DRAFT_544869 [Bisporella sp. PMI_857]